MAATGPAPPATRPAAAAATVRAGKLHEERRVQGGHTVALFLWIKESPAAPSDPIVPDS